MLGHFCSVLLTFTPGARLAQYTRGMWSNSQAVNILQPRAVATRLRAGGIVAFEEGSGRPRSDKELSAIFYEFDTSGDGFIDVEELRAALAKAGKPVSMQEAKTILDQVDTKGDGKISLEEFKAVFKMSPGSVPDVLKSFFDLFSIQGLISDLGVGGQWRRTEAGAKYLDDVVGDGKLVVPGDFVQMHYSITALSTGQVLETTRSGGIGRPLGYLVGAPDGKRTSWEDSVAGMRIGGRRRVYVASYCECECECEGVYVASYKDRYAPTLLTTTPSPLPTGTWRPTRTRRARSPTCASTSRSSLWRVLRKQRRRRSLQSSVGVARLRVPSLP
jgi:hypothetical protein